MSKHYSHIRPSRPGSPKRLARDRRIASQPAPQTARSKKNASPVQPAPQTARSKKNASPVQPAAPMNRRHPPHPLFSQDGYTNPASFLGAASPLISSGTFLRSGLSWNQELLTTIYRESWIAKKIIDMPAEDMTRAWYTIAGDLSPEDTAALHRLEARHSLRNEIANALKWARLYGGSLAVIVLRGEENRLDQPLDPGRIIPGSFQGILVVDRVQGITPSLELEDNLDDPDFGLPLYYDINADLGEAATLRVHHSRVLRFIGRELPYMEMQRESFWGASELEHIWEELQKRSATSANIAQLVFQANITTLKMSDFGELLALGTPNQRRRVLDAVEEQNRLRTSFGLQLLSSEDSWENHPYAFSGLSEIYELFMLDIAGAAEIPATRLFGRSPQGLNATGESDLKIYYEHIAQLQETCLRPALEKLLPILEISAFGYYAEDSEIVFHPIATTTPAERVAILSQLSASMVSLYQSGLISRSSALAEMQSIGRELGAFSHLAEPEAQPLASPALPVSVPAAPEASSSSAIS